MQTELTDLIGGAPSQLDTLREITDSLNNNATLSNTLVASIAAAEANIVAANTYAEANRVDKDFILETDSSLTFGVKLAKDGILRTSNEILTQKGVDMNKIREIWTDIPFFSKEIDEQVEINAHYRGYLKKQKADILAFKRDENLIIPDKINYDGLSGLSNEVKAKFKEIKPKTMGQALRIDGITPAAVYILLSHVKRKSIKHIA